jgi:aryl-alcohol dehydrogenase-like predicted oxidoreductase
MGMSDFYGPADESESLATIQEVIDRGVTLLNTGDFYGMGHNEMLIRRALEGRRDRAFLSVKFGAQLAIAWVLDQGDDLVPLVGARRRDRLREALGALDVRLTAEDRARIAAAVPANAVAGDRYDPHGMKMVGR